MKKSELRQIIKEEIKLLSEEFSADKIKNPKTGRMIKVSSALSYPKDTEVYKAAAKASIQGKHKKVEPAKTDAELRTIQSKLLKQTIAKSTKHENALKDKLKNIPVGIKRYAAIQQHEAEKKKIWDEYFKNPDVKEFKRRAKNQ